MSVTTEPQHDFDVIPKKKLQGTSKIKAAIEILKFTPVNGLELDAMVAIIAQKKYEQLPGPLALKNEIPIPFTMQMVFRKINAREFQVLRHFNFEQKLDSRLLMSAVSGELYLLDYGKSFRSGALGFQFLLEKLGDFAILAFEFVPKKTGKPPKAKTALELGFDHIKKNGPRSNMGNRQTEWAEIEIHREESPIFGWTAGLVKESLRGYANSNIFVEPTYNYFLTMYDLSSWFLEDVVFPLLPDMKTKTFVMLGKAGAGKTPAAQAIAMAFAEYWILRANQEHELRPCFRLSNSLENLRGEPGLRERPDILDDSDMSNIPLPKIKAFLDSSLSETFTVERWTTTKFVLNQLRISCDNRVHAEAEEGIKIGQDTIPFHVFVDYIKPAFHEKAQKEDIQACLKRAHFVVNMNEAVYVRPAGAGESPIRLVRYPETQNRSVIRDFIAESGKPIIAKMLEGCAEPPADWLTKRQWCHDLLTHMIESNNPEIPRIQVIRRQSPFGGPLVTEEVKPVLPSSGRTCVLLSVENHADDGQKAQANHAGDGQEAPELPSGAQLVSLASAVRVKEEPKSPDRSTFRALKKQRAVIELDTPSPAKPRPATVLDDNGFPPPGHGEDIEEDLPDLEVDGEPLYEAFPDPHLDDDVVEEALPDPE